MISYINRIPFSLLLSAGIIYAAACRPQVPTADDLADLTVQRIVVRAGLSHDLARALIADIRTEVDFLNRLESPMPREGDGSHFHH